MDASSKGVSPRAEIARLAPYRSVATTAPIRVDGNEWTEQGHAGDYVTADDLNLVLLNRYPDECSLLRQRLSEKWQLLPEELTFGNGSVELMLCVFLAFGGNGRRTLLFQPTYPVHERMTVIAGGTVVNELVGLPFDLTRERAIDAVRRASPHIVVFTSPNNPTGNTIAADVVLGVSEQFPDTLVFADEAYADFAGMTLLPRIHDHPNLIVSRTFSKSYAAAGLRLGVLIANVAVSRVIGLAKVPNNVSALTQAIALRLIDQDDEVSRRVATASHERERMIAALRQVSNIEVFPSTANFVLIRSLDVPVRDVHARLLEEGIAVRDVSSWTGAERCVRFSIGTPAENDRIVDGIRRAVSAAF